MIGFEWDSAAKRKAGLVVVSALLIAAGWRGVVDTPFNPREMTHDQYNAYVWTEVNLNNNSGPWVIGDTLSFCQGGTNTCILLKFRGYTTNPWDKLMDIDTRDKPWLGWWQWLWELIFSETAPWVYTGQAISYVDLAPMPIVSGYIAVSDLVIVGAGGGGGGGCSADPDGCPIME